MKKILIFALVLAVITLPHLAIAQQAVGNSGGGTSFVPLAPIPGLDSGANAVSTSQGGLAKFLNNLYIYLIGIAVVLAIVEIIIGGLEITTKDSVSKNRDGKDRIWRALLGLALVLLPVLVFTIINPSILQLDINMPPLDLSHYTGLTGTNANGSNPSCVGTGTTTCGTLGDNGQFTTTTTYYPCNGSDCTAAKAQCQNRFAGQTGGYTVYPQVVCMNGSGTVDPNGVTDSRLNPFSEYSCVSGETVTVACSETGNGSGSGAYAGH